VEGAVQEEVETGCPGADEGEDYELDPESIYKHAKCDSVAGRSDGLNNQWINESKSLKKKRDRTLDGTKKSQPPCISYK
jgi:hypothetical protein